MTRMDTTHLVLLFLAVGLIAFLYSSVGHAGASGYIATMTLFGLAPTVIRPTALVLNILVASIGTFQFWRAGHFSWKLFWPFALLSIPAAYVGGYLSAVCFGSQNSDRGCAAFFRRAIGVSPSDPPQTVTPSRPVAIGVGAGLGFLSGLTGTGGGIFLTPLLLFCQWAHIRQAAAVSALFIWVNSIAGLVGIHKSSFNSFAWSYPCSRGDHWRHYGLVSGKQASCCPCDFTLSGNGSPHRRNETDFH